MIYQHTIAHPVSISGIGLHSGKTINMTLRPADAGTGIVFYRSDVQGRVAIEAVSANVVDTRLATVLGKDGLTVSTVEHLLATLSALGIDNLSIDIDGPEVPVLDGSARLFVDKLSATGLRQQKRRRKTLVIKQAMSISDGDKWIHLLPSRFFRITCDVDYNHPCAPAQSRSFKVTSETFTKDIASARTFGFFKEVEYLKAHGLARGGSLENAVVIGDDRILNPEGLRYSDEFVRHKILDAIGDFSLLGYPIRGHIKANKPGHDINHRMVEKLLAAPECWKLVEFDGHESETVSPLSIFSSEPMVALSQG
jgi:UDP-3-O-[3-hydroxymyristoyl] N-acetylglucosamine deacetylase